MQNERCFAPGRQAIEIGPGGHLSAKNGDLFTEVDEAAHFLNGLLSFAQHRGSRWLLEPACQSLLSFRGSGRAEKLEEGSRPEDIEVGAKGVVRLEEILSGHPFAGPAILDLARSPVRKSAQARSMAARWRRTASCRKSRMMKPAMGMGMMAVVSCSWPNESQKAKATIANMTRRERPIQTSVLRSF